MRRFIDNFARDEAGQSLTEYTLLIAFVALVSVSLMLNLGGGVSNAWDSAGGSIDAAAAVAEGGSAGLDSGGSTDAGTGTSTNTATGSRHHHRWWWRR